MQPLGFCNNLANTGILSATFMSLPWRLLTIIICCMCCTCAWAQTCTGSLGDPIVNISFGAGGNFGKPLPSGVTSNLQFVASTCPNDGFYTITNSTSGCFGSSWLTVRDHTGDPNGYFMLINASYDPSVFFVQNIDGLCPGTTYEFAAWVINVLGTSGILPDISFTIETTGGDTLGLYNTGSIPVDRTVKWQQYGLTFTTPPDVGTIVLRMRNNAPGGNGNDLGVDDITFRPAGPAIQVGIVGYTETDLVVCRDDTRSFEFNAVIDPCYLSSDYQWQLSRDSGRSWVNIPGATSVGYARSPETQPGTYWYRIAVAQRGNIGITNCRTVSTPIRIYTPPIPDPYLGQDAYLCKGDSLELVPGNFDRYRWQDGSDAPNFMVRQGGNYSVTVSNACESVSASVVITERVCDLFFPTAFTPNADGRNDVFRLLSAYALERFELAIFNRWGQQVFYTENELEGWDGKIRGQEAQNGQYVWTCTAKLAGTGKILSRKGIVNLIR